MELEDVRLAFRTEWRRQLPDVTKKEAMLRAINRLVGKQAQYDYKKLSEVSAVDLEKATARLAKLTLGIRVNRPEYDELFRRLEEDGLPGYGWVKGVRFAHFPNYVSSLSRVVASLRLGFVGLCACDGKELETALLDCLRAAGIGVEAEEEPECESSRSVPA